MQPRYLSSLLFALVWLVFAGCTKDALHKKPDSSLNVPVTVSDFQAILDAGTATTVANTCLTDIMTDDIDIRNYPLSNLFFFDTSIYYWGKDMFQNVSYVPEWQMTYSAVFAANTVLEGIDKARADSTDRNHVKGSALLLRAVGFLSIAGTWAPPYEASTAASQPGVQLRLTSSLQPSDKRATLQATYAQVIADLEAATDLLPDVSDYNQHGRCRPSKAAALGYLARTYLLMGDYAHCLNDAQQSLQLYDVLVDYNTRQLTGGYPLPPASSLDAECVMYVANGYPYPYGTARIDSSLVATYAVGDLRAQLFQVAAFTPSQVTVSHYQFVSLYGDGGNQFTGLGTDELYLMLAECQVRTGALTEGLHTLNQLLVKRFRTGTFTPVTATNATDALLRIREERRKCLLMRGLRWQDIRRGNLETDTRFHTTLQRTYNGNVYTLQPGDTRYTLPIPDYIIKQNGITQNP